MIKHFDSSHFGTIFNNFKTVLNYGDPSESLRFGITCVNLQAVILKSILYFEPVIFEYDNDLFKKLIL